MDTGNRHILITDDNPTNIILLDRVLQRMGYDISHAETGEETIRLLENEDFDLVLLDIMLPGMSGYEVLDWIRQRYSLESLPVILISALTDESNIIEGLEMGANDYVTKPINVDVVQLRVDTQLKIKQAFAEKAYVAEQLRKTNDMQNRLMHIASHDLKNPINNVTMSLQLLEYKFGGDDMLTIAVEQLKKMEDIVHEFLEQELIQNDRLQVKREAVSYDKVLEYVLIAYQHAADAKGISIHVDLSGQEVLGDPSRLEQVLNNLVSNAIKYATPNTSVTISDDVYDETVRLKIHNIGEPIPEAEMNLLFQPFSKLSTRPTAGEHSSGLGLWIVQQMMEVQDGAVGTNPQVTDGAEFWIELPRQSEALSDETSATMTSA